MKDMAAFKVETLSNLLIGGASVSFEIGGIDQHTVVDREEFPYIPGSAIKGSLRTIIRDDKSSMAKEITNLYISYLKEKRDEDRKLIQEFVKEKEKLDRIEAAYKKVLRDASAEYLFGIKGFDHTPKLLFEDLLLIPELRNKEMCFSIDMKNNIIIGEEKPESNPRSYKTARSGLIFEGAVRFYRLGLLGENAEELCRAFIIENLKKFNSGIYRLGNSKSRGYGKIKVIPAGESEANKE